MLRNGSHNPREYAHIQAPANLEEQALTLCGKDIYQKLIKGYTEKQWVTSRKIIRPQTHISSFKQTFNQLIVSAFRNALILVINLPDVLTSITIFVSGIWNTVVFVLNTNVWKWKIITPCISRTTAYFSRHSPDNKVRPRE